MFGTPIAADIPMHSLATPRRPATVKINAREYFVYKHTVTDVDLSQSQ